MPSEFELESLPGTVKVIIDRAAASGLKRFSKAFWAPNIPEIQAATFEEPKNKIDAAYLAPEYTRDWILKVSKKLSEVDHIVQGVSRWIILTHLSFDGRTLTALRMLNG